MRGAIKHAIGLVSFSIEIGADSGIELTGGKSMVLLRDYLESLAGRGRTVSGAAEGAISLTADAFRAERPLTRPLVLAAADVESNDFLWRSPHVKLDAPKPLESFVRNKLAPTYRRASTIGVALVAYARLRSLTYRGSGRSRSLPIQRAAHFQTRKPRKRTRGGGSAAGPPVGGLTGSAERAQPILTTREVYQKLGDRDLHCAFPRARHAWGLVSTGPSPACATRPKASFACCSPGNVGGRNYTPRPPGGLSPTAANRMNFDQRELGAFGRWPIAFRIPERYGRSVRAGELALRNIIVR